MITSPACESETCHGASIAGRALIYAVPPSQPSNHATTGVGVGVGEGAAAGAEAEVGVGVGVGVGAKGWDTIEYRPP